MDRRKILLVVAVVVAALGAGLVFVYAQGAEDRARDDITTTPVLVATQDILPGESAADAADAGKLLSQQVPEDQVLPGSTNVGADFTDSIALTTIYAGEQLLTQKFGTIDEIEGAATLPLPTGKSAITLSMTNAGRVSSFTKPGSHVAIYYVPRPADGSTDSGTGSPIATTEFGAQPACAIESDVLVLGVGSTSVDQRPAPIEDDGDGSQAQEDIVEVTYLTIAVDSQQAARLVPFQQAQERNQGDPILSFALRNDESNIVNTRGCADFLRSFDEQLQLATTRNANG